MTHSTRNPKAPHCTWAKDGEVIIQVTGIGPSGKTAISCLGAFGRRPHQRVDSFVIPATETLAQWQTYARTEIAARRQRESAPPNRALRPGRVAHSDANSVTPHCRWPKRLESSAA